MITTSRIDPHDEVVSHQNKQWLTILCGIADTELTSSKEKKLKHKLIQILDKDPTAFLAERNRILNPPTGFFGWWIRLFTFVLKTKSPLYVSLRNTLMSPILSAQSEIAEATLPVRNSISDLTSTQIKAEQSPAQTLYDLFQEYDSEKLVLNEKEFIQLHKMTQILMEECVCTDTIPEYHEYHVQRIQYLLILMNTNLFPEFIALIKMNPEKKLHMILDKFYSDKRLAITKLTKDSMKLKNSTAFNDFEYKQTIAEKTEHNYLDSPNEILTEQLNSGQFKKTSLNFYFARIATEQLLMNYYARPEHKRHLKLEKSNQTLHQTIQNISKHILLTWNDNTYSSSSALLSLGPNAAIPTTFAGLEQDWIAPLLIDLQRGGIEQAITTILDKSATGNFLSEQQINWIVSRLSYYFRNSEEIKRIQETLLLEKNRISPLITLLNEITVVESTKTRAEGELAPLHEKLSEESNRLKDDSDKIWAHIIKCVEPRCKAGKNTTGLTDIAQKLKSHKTDITPLRRFSVFCHVQPREWTAASHELICKITPQ